MALIPTLRQYRVTFERIAHSPEILLQCPACVGQGAHQQYGRLYFNTAKRVGICQRCGWNGKELQLLQLLDIRASSTLDIPEERPVVQKRRISPFPIEAIPAWQSKDAMRYLHSRNMTDVHIEQFACFYCSEGFYAYWNPKGAPLSQMLYNIHFLRQTHSVWLTEGVFDSIHCFPYACATFGKKISDAQITVLRLCGIQRVFLLWDAEAWQKTPDEWEKAVERLRRYFFTYPVKLPHSTPTEFVIDELQAMCRDVL